MPPKKHNGEYLIAIYQELFLKAFPALEGRPGTIDDRAEKVLRKAGISVDYVRTLGGGGGQPLYERMMGTEREARGGRINILLVGGMTDGYRIAQRSGATVTKTELSAEELRAQFETLATQYAWPGWEKVWEELADKR